MHLPWMAALLCAAANQPAPAPPASSSPAASAPSSGAAPERKEKRKGAGKPPMIGVLNVNRATEAELRLLPGIGKNRAQLIVERRDKKPFTSLDEVGRIKGMRNLVHRLRAFLVVQGETTLRPMRP